MEPTDGACGRFVGLCERGFEIVSPECGDKPVFGLSPGRPIFKRVKMQGTYCPCKAHIIPQRRAV